MKPYKPLFKEKINPRADTIAKKVKNELADYYSDPEMNTEDIFNVTLRVAKSYCKNEESLLDDVMERCGFIDFESF